MEVMYESRPELESPTMIAAWPGMGYLAKISADYLRRRLKAKRFAEIRYYQNAISYNNGLAQLPSVGHKFYFVPGRNIVICVGDAQPSTPEEALRLGKKVVEMAEEMKVARLFTMAAYPVDYHTEPRVFGVYTDEGLRAELEEHGVEFIEGEGAVNGLNGILIGLAKQRGIDGACLMGEIRYANVPQHLSAKAVLERLTSILGVEIDTAPLVKRAEKVDASIRKSLDEYNEIEESSKKEEKIRYIS
jgi:hypothetical protein